MGKRPCLVCRDLPAPCDACIEHRRARHAREQRRYRSTPEGRTRATALTNAWLAKHPEYERERSKRRYATDSVYRARIREASKAWGAKHPEYYRNAAHKRRVLERGAGFLSVEELEARLAEFPGCVYCGRSDVPMTVDHVVPLSKGGQHVRENVVAACKSCNSRKGPRPASFMGERYGAV